MQTLKTILRNIKTYKWVFRSLPSTIYFNFHYLPFKQAILLLIWLYKPRLFKCRGSIELRVLGGGVKTGMIRLGVNRVSIYPNNGFKYENHGGHIVFDGGCCIGNNSSISVGDKASLIFGDCFDATTSLKIVAYNEIQFGSHNLIGWDCLFMDTDLHRLTNMNGTMSKGFGTIQIGNNNWFACNCVVTKNTKTPDYCSVSLGSHVHGDISKLGERILIGNERTVEVLKEGVFLDWSNNKIKY